MTTDIQTFGQDLVWREANLNCFILMRFPHRFVSYKARWPSGLRRCVQARISAIPQQQFRSLPEAWVRIPLLSNFLVINRLDQLFMEGQYYRISYVARQDGRVV